MSVIRALATVLQRLRQNHHGQNQDVDFRLISTKENYPWIGTDKKIFLCLVSSGLELMTLINTKKNFLARSNPRIIFLSGN
jgi:hypothetical protein